MYITSLFRRGDVIHVRDSRWGYLHKGIVHSVVFSGMQFIVRIIDNSKERGSVGYCTLEEFANGEQVNIERRASSPAEADWIVRRAETKLRTVYNLLTWNCQHLVNWVLAPIELSVLFSAQTQSPSQSAWR